MAEIMITDNLSCDKTGMITGKMDNSATQSHNQSINQSVGHI